MKRKLLNKRGFVSIEAVISMASVLFVIFLAIGFYVYMQPKIMLEKEVHILAQKAKMQGGLTNATSQPVDSDIEMFTKTLGKMGYDMSKVQITAVTNPGNLNCIGVTPLKQTGSNYVRRDSKQLIVITVKVPANKSGLTAPIKFFGMTDGLDDFYYIREAVLSERW